jgi:hypothetical protein
VVVVVMVVVVHFLKKLPPFIGIGRSNDDSSARDFQPAPVPVVLVLVLVPV